jgi:hypothetical protein
LGFPADTAAAAGLPPNGDLRVAYRQLQNGKLSEVFWETTLTCWEGTCSLTAISFGACLETPGLGRVWFPGARTVITGRDEFLVTKVGATVLEAEERGLGTTIKYRWSFTTIEDTNAGKVGRRQNRMFDNLTGFSGSAIHPHPSLQTWELIPFKGQLVKAQPECDLAVAGVPK